MLIAAGTSRCPLTHQPLRRFAVRSFAPAILSTLSWALAKVLHPVNTSFNIRGEPIACTLEDGFRCFVGTDIDVLAMEDCWLQNEQQDRSLRLGYKSRFEPD